MSQVAVWVIVALGAGILEVVVPAFGFVFVTLAALLAAVLALLDYGLTVQVVAFAASALLFLFVLRRFFVHRLRGPGVPSRTEAITGKLAEVTEPIDLVRGSGRVIVEGHDWAARASVPIPAGGRVRIDGADGIVLLVSPVQKGL
jgi:membrane protein implicated in regulation of membrane protease activity